MLEKFLFLLLVPTGIGAFGMVFYNLSKTKWNKNRMKNSNQGTPIGKLSTSYGSLMRGEKKLMMKEEILKNASGS